MTHWKTLTSSVTMLLLLLITSQTQAFITTTGVTIMAGSVSEYRLNGIVRGGIALQAKGGSPQTFGNLSSISCTDYTCTNNSANPIAVLVTLTNTSELIKRCDIYVTGVSEQQHLYANQATNIAMVSRTTRETIVQPNASLTIVPTSDCFGSSEAKYQPLTSTDGTKIVTHMMITEL